MPGRRWVCRLMREHGDWDKVLEDKRYTAIVQPLWESAGLGRYNCRDWPQNHPAVMLKGSGQCCFGVDG